MDNSGLAYQVFGEEVRLLLADKRGEVAVEEDMSVDELMGQDQGNPLLTYTIGHVQPP
jgi:hypothetical protein